MNHLSNIQIESYRKRAMKPAELLAADSHLTTCEDCRKKLSEAEQVKMLYAYLKSDLMSAASEELRHPACEELLVFAENRLDEISREIIESHLEICSTCSEEIVSLRTADRQIAPAFAASVPVQQDAVRREIDNSPSVWERFASLFRSPGVWQPLQAAAMIVVAIISAWAAVGFMNDRAAGLQMELEKARNENEILKRENSSAKANIGELEAKVAQLQNSSKDGEAEMLAVLNDGGKSISLNAQGELKGIESLPENYSRILRDALKNESVKPPAGIMELVGRSGSLMSGSSENAFTVISPIGTVIETDSPAFRWKPLSGAESYVLSVYDSNFNLIAKSEPIKDTSWTVNKTLTRGVVYSWQVTAVKDGKEIVSPSPSSPEAKFKVLDQGKANELKKAKPYNSHLMLGTLYAQAGMLDDAEREFQSLVKANPESEVAKNILRSVKRIRQTK